MERENALNEIFIKRVGVDFKKQQHLRDKKLLGIEINAPSRELVMVLYDIENKFCIRIEDEFILGGGFDTFNNIAGYLDHLGAIDLNKL